jgi:hypothetical protein
MCFVFILEQTATCATYSINRLVFVTEMKSVYSAVRTGPLNKAVCASALNGYFHLITTNKTVFKKYRLLGYCLDKIINIFLIFAWQYV